jgi:hypothetical protein
MYDGCVSPLVTSNRKVQFLSAATMFISPSPLGQQQQASSMEQLVVYSIKQEGTVLKVVVLVRLAFGLD